MIYMHIIFASYIFAGSFICFQIVFCSLFCKSVLFLLFRGNVKYIKIYISIINCNYFIDLEGYCRVNSEGLPISEKWINHEN